MSLFQELKRRNVFRVGLAYVVGAWVLLQIIDFVLEVITAPDWILQVFFLAAVVGLPVVLIISWVFEMTPEGIRRESDINRSESITAHTSQKLGRVIVVFLALAVILLLADKFLLDKPEPAANPDGMVNETLAADTADASDTLTEPATSNRQSIAVLPFVNRSRSEDDAFFVDGMHDDLLTHLAKISALKVISRTSVMPYRDTQKSLPTIGQELGVSTIMEGSVQRAGKRIRINVQLIDTSSDEHLWAEIYDRELTTTNIFEIQSEIATAIAGALRTALTLEETQRLAIRPTENLAAYEAYLLGRQRLARRNSEALSEAVSYFQQAVDLDPEFALAYVGLADSWALHIDYSGMSLEETIARSLPHVEKALQLDDQSGEAYTALASIRELEGDYDAAQIAYKRALELAPNYAQAAFWYGLFQVNAKGQPDLALPLYEQALALDPLSTIVLYNYSVCLEMLGRFSEAWAVIEKALVIDPDFGFNYSGMANAYQNYEGRLDTAVEWQYKGLEIDPANLTAYSNLSFFFNTLQDDTQAMCWADMARQLDDESSTGNLALSLASFYAGNFADAENYAGVSIRNTWILSWKILPLAILKHLLVQGGREEAVLALYREHAQELFPASQVSLNRVNFKIAIDLAHLLQTRNRDDEAQQLLTAAWAYIQNIPRKGEFGSWVDDARILVLQGKPEAALTALEQAVHSGWRTHWRFYLEHDPIFQPIRNEPEFQALLTEIHQDMASQFEQVRQQNYTAACANL